MKRILCAILLLTMVLTLCACDKDDETAKLEVSLKDLVAAVQQNCGAKTADKLIGMEDADFAAMLNMYLGIDAGILSDGAMAISTTTAANEIVILQVKDSSDADDVKQAFETHISDTIMSDERYFPENVELLNNAIVYENGSCVILIVDEMTAMVKNTVETLLENQTLVADAAAAFYADSAKKPDYKYEEPVPGNDIVDFEWFNDAMFIGDSRMKGVMNNAVEGNWFKPGRDLSLVGLTVSNLYTEYVSVDGQSVTVADGIRMAGNFSKCYILLGINELGWGSSDRFIECYKELVELVKDAHPEAQIYIIGNMPLGEKAVESGDWLTNDNVVRFNGYIQQVSSEEQVYYIDAYSFLQVNGSLPAESANDGIHVQPDVCRKLVEYLMSHTVAE